MNKLTRNNAKAKPKALNTKYYNELIGILMTGYQSLLVFQNDETKYHLVHLSNKILNTVKILMELLCLMQAAIMCLWKNYVTFKHTVFL
jgi:hypothetical protein